MMRCVPQARSKLKQMSTELNLAPTAKIYNVRNALRSCNPDEKGQRGEQLTNRDVWWRRRPLALTVRS